MGYLDRIEIEFTSDVSILDRDAIHEAILSVVIDTADYEDAPRLYSYERLNTSNGAHRIEITAHDRTTFDLTDGQVIERLRIAAKDQGINVRELLQRLASDDR